MEHSRTLARIRIVPAAVRDALSDASAIRARARVDAESFVRDAVATAVAEAKVTAVARVAAAADAFVRDAALRETDIVAVAMEVARDVIGREVRESADVLHASIARALARLTRAHAVILRVHPEDESTARSRLARMGAHEFAWEIAADPSISRGGVVADSDLGTVDARLERQLDAIARALGAE